MLFLLDSWCELGPQECVIYITGNCTLQSLASLTYRSPRCLRLQGRTSKGRLKGVRTSPCTSFIQNVIKLIHKKSAQYRTEMDIQPSPWCADGQMQPSTPSYHSLRCRCLWVWCLSILLWGHTPHSEFKIISFPSESCSSHLAAMPTPTLLPPWSWAAFWVPGSAALGPASCP